MDEGDVTSRGRWEIVPWRGRARRDFIASRPLVGERLARRTWVVGEVRARACAVE